MQNRLIKCFLIFLMMSSITFQLSSNVSAVYECGGITDDCECGGVSNPFGCQLGNCTWWVWHRICCIWGGEPAREIAYNWGLPIKTCEWNDKARNSSFFEVNHTPAVRTVAVREAHADNRYNGHVAWVEAVNGDHVTVTEMASRVSYPGGYRTMIYSSDYFDGGYIHYHNWSIPQVDEYEKTPHSGTPIPVYRFDSLVTGKQLLTIDENGKNDLQNNNNWRYKGVVWHAYRKYEKDTLPVYRFYSPVLGGHIFTMDENGKNDLILNRSHIWRYEGIAYFAYPKQASGTAPVYRLYSLSLRNHFFTMDENEKASLEASGLWRYEGIAYYAFPNG